MHKAVGILSVDGQQVKPERVDDARDDEGLLHDVRRAVPVRRHLDRRGGHRPGARDGHFAQDEREALRRREQRRQAHALERQRVPHRRRARPLDAAADVLRRQQRQPRGAGGRLHPVRLECGARAYSAGNTNGWKPEDIQTYQDFLNSESVWIQMWVELPDAAARNRFQAFLDNYAQRAEAGRPLPAAAQQPPHEAGPVAAGQQRRRQRRPRAGRPRLRLPGRVPPEHRRPAAREVPEQCAR